MIHEATCVCGECVYGESLRQGWVETPDLDGHMPSPAMQALEERRPGIGWLCALPRDQRRWYLEPERLSRLIDMFPDVTESEWLQVLK